MILEVLYGSKLKIDSAPSSGGAVFILSYSFRFLSYGLSILSYGLVVLSYGFALVSNESIFCPLSDEKLNGRSPPRRTALGGAVAPPVFRVIMGLFSYSGDLLSYSRMMLSYRLRLLSYRPFLVSYKRIHSTFALSYPFPPLPSV